MSHLTNRKSYLRRYNQLKESKLCTTCKKLNLTEFTNCSDCRKSRKKYPRTKRWKYQSKCTFPNCKVNIKPKNKYCENHKYSKDFKTAYCIMCKKSISKDAKKCRECHLDFIRVKKISSKK